jgi:hypothetical protein
MMFVSLIMIFEFAIMLFDPVNDRYSRGLPVWKMGFNTLLGVGLRSLHAWAERRLKARLLRTS